MFSVFLLFSLFSENMSSGGVEGGVSMGKGGGFYVRRVYADVIGRFGGGSRAKFRHCGRVWACLAVDVTNFYFVGCGG